MSRVKDYLIDQIERIARENHYSFELIYQAYWEYVVDNEETDFFAPLEHIERVAKEQDYDEGYLEFCNPCYF